MPDRELSMRDHTASYQLRSPPHPSQSLMDPDSNFVSVEVLLGSDETREGLLQLSDVNDFRDLAAERLSRVASFLWLVGKRLEAKDVLVQCEGLRIGGPEPEELPIETACTIFTGLDNDGQELAKHAASSNKADILAKISALIAHQSDSDLKVTYRDDFISGDVEPFLHDCWSGHQELLPLHERIKTMMRGLAELGGSDLFRTAVKFTLSSFQATLNSIVIYRQFRHLEAQGSSDDILGTPSLVADSEQSETDDEEEEDEEGGDEDEDGEVEAEPPAL